MHKRQTLRNGVVSNLTGLSTTGSNVFASRIYNLADSELPALKVYTAEEELIEDSVAGYQGVIGMELRIECAVKANDTFDDVLDDILEEVQAAMSADRLKDTAINLYYTGLSDVEFQEGETDIGTQSIIYRVEYEQLL